MFAEPCRTARISARFKPWIFTRRILAEVVRLDPGRRLRCSHICRRPRESATAFTLLVAPATAGAHTAQLCAPLSFQRITSFDFGLPSLCKDDRYRRGVAAWAPAFARATENV